MLDTNKWIVLGLGNVLYRDEGLGVHALNALRDALLLDPKPGLPEVELLDGGTLGLNLLPIVESASHLLVLDAVDANAQPGAVVELGKDAIMGFGGMCISQHQISFHQVIGLASIRECLPENLHLIGAQPAELTPGLNLSPQVSAAIPEVIARAQSVLSKWYIAKNFTLVSRAFWADF